jgi:hypothetical protein
VGLAVHVGILLDVAESHPEMLDQLRDDFLNVNAVLEENGLPGHDEPEAAAWEPLSLDMYGYSGLVQEAYDAAAGKPRLFRRGRKFDRRFDHLLLHSDAEGFYVPVEFDEVLFSDHVPGVMLGSSHALVRECEELMSVLAIPSDVDPESEELWDASEAQSEGDGWRRYGVEAFTCVRLFAAARESLKRSAALAFA